MIILSVSKNTKFLIIVFSSSALIIYIYIFIRTRYNMKIRQIGHTPSQYGQSFFPKAISAWHGLAFAEAPSLAVFRSNFL